MRVRGGNTLGACFLSILASYYRFSSLSIANPTSTTGACSYTIFTLLYFVSHPASFVYLVSAASKGTTSEHM